MNAGWFVNKLIKIIVTAVHQHIWNNCNTCLHYESILSKYKFYSNINCYVSFQYKSSVMQETPSPMWHGPRSQWPSLCLTLWWSHPHPLEDPEPEPQYPVGATPHPLFYSKGPLAAAHCSPLIMTYPLSSTSYFHFDLVRVIFRIWWRAGEGCEHMKTQKTSRGQRLVCDFNVNIERRLMCCLPGFLLPMDAPWTLCATAGWSQWVHWVEVQKRGWGEKRNRNLESFL